MKQKSLRKFKKYGPKAVVFLLLAALVLTFLPPDPGSYAAFTSGNAIDDKTGAVDIVPTLQDGQVWTGKTVDADPDTPDPNDVNKDNDQFGVTLSALGQNYRTTTEGGIQPVNVALVLDISGSMDSNKISNMVNSANQLIGLLLPNATGNQNKVGVATFDDNASTLVTLRDTKFDLSTSTSDSNTFRIAADVNATNIQSGMNVGYSMLNTAKSNNDSAAPIMIVLTDGGTWYYRTDYKNIPTSNSGWSTDTYGGDGTSNGNGLQAAAYTIIQAAYLKTQMPELKMYTIGFDVGSNVLIKATLDPTSANINAVTGGNTDSLGERLSAIDTADTQYNYDYHYPETGGAYLSGVTPGDLVDSFLQALGDITSNNAPLKQGSSLVITDTISDDFMLSPSESLVVNRNGTNYTLSLNAGVYTNVSLSGLMVTIADGTLTWTIPANLLPVNSYDTSGSTPVLVTANPITLNFQVELDGSSEADTNYYTNYDADPGTEAGATSIFTPAQTNEHYYNATPGTEITYPTSDWEVTVTRTFSSSSWHYALTSLKQNDNDIAFNTSSITDVQTNGNGNATRCDISATLADGTKVSFNDVSFNPFIGKSNVNVRTEGDLAAAIDYSGAHGTTPTYTKKSDVGFIGDTDNVSIAMNNTGMIRLKTALADLTITKEVESFGNAAIPPEAIPTNGFEFTLFTGPDAQHLTQFGEKFYLNDGEHIDITLPVGTYYNVVETTVSSFETTALNATGSVDEIMSPVAFTNTYYPTATVDVSKTIHTLYNITIPNATFPFGLYYKDGDNYVKIDGPEASVTSTNPNNSPYSDEMTVKIKKLAELGLFGTGNTAVVYVHEDTMTGEPTGWTNDTRFIPITISKDGTVNYGADITVAAFTNDYVPKTTLTVTKATAGGTDPADGFGFTINLGATGTPAFNYTYVINREGGAIENGNGTAPASIEVSLGSGDNIVISGIPVGTQYNVTEDDYSTLGFSPSLGSGQALTGSVAAGGTSVNVTNTLYKNDIKVSKMISGGDPDKLFTFTLYQGQNIVTGYSYEINGTAYSAADGTFTLKGGQTATLKSLPVGTTYTVTETDEGAYTTESKLNQAAFSTGKSVNVPLTFGSSAIPEVTFKNSYKTGSLTVTKAVLIDGNTGGGDELYTVEVSFTGDGYLAGITADGATKVFDGKFTASLKKGDSVTFENVPADADYTVEETVDQGADSVTYSPSASGTVCFNEESCVQITNSFLTPATLTISKVVNDSNNLTFNPENTSFGFEIYFYTTIHHDAVSEEIDENGRTITEGKDAYDEPVPYVLADNEKPEGLTPGDSNGYYTFSLKDGDSISFNNLPVGVKFTVTEVDDADAHGTTVIATGATVNGITASGEILQDAGKENPISIQYTNDYSITAGTLELSKTVSDRASVHEGGFEFVVEFIGQSDGITCKKGETIIDPVAEAENPMTFAITLNAAEAVTFSGLLDGTQYTITELTKADSTVFTGAGDTGTNEEGQATASGTMVMPATLSWKVGDVEVNCENTYNPPETTTEKTASDDAVAKNTPVVYTVKVTNTSDYVIELSYIEDNMLANATNVLLNDSAAGFGVDRNTEDETPTPRLFLDENLVMQPGDAATLKYTVSFTSYGPKENTATSFAYYGEYEITSTDTTTVTVYPDSSIDVAKQVKYLGDYGETVAADYNETVTYKVIITNNNEAALNNIRLNDALLSDTTLQIVSAKLGDNDLDYSITGNEITFYIKGTETLVTLNSQQSIEFIYTITADDDYINTATVYGFDGRTDVDDTDTASVTIKTPSIKVIKAGTPGTLLIGESVDYTITIENTYDQALDLVSVKDRYFVPGTGYTLNTDSIHVVVDGAPLDPNTDYTLNTTAGTLSLAITEGESTTYPSFAPGAAHQVVITYTVVFSVAGQYTNTAEATAQYNGKAAVDNDSNDNTVKVQVNDPTVGFTVDKRANNEKDITVSSGTPVTYTVTVTNIGDVALGIDNLTDVMFTASGINIVSLDLITDTSSTPMPLNYHFDSSDPSILRIEQPENWLFLEPGSHVTLTYTRTMTASYENTVTANLYKGEASPLQPQISQANVNVSIIPPPPESPTPTTSTSPSPSPSPSESPSPSASVLGTSDDGSGVAGDNDKLPQTGGIAPSTLLGLFGLGLIAVGGTTFVIFRKKSDGKSK